MALCQLNIHVVASLEHVADVSAYTDVFVKSYMIIVESYMILLESYMILLESYMILLESYVILTKIKYHSSLY